AERLAVAGVAMLRLVHLIPDQQEHAVGILAFEIFVEPVAWIFGRILLARPRLRSAVAALAPQRHMADRARPLAASQPCLRGDGADTFLLLHHRIPTMRAFRHKLAAQALVRQITL